MKRLYFLLLLCCCLGITAFAQVTTVTLYATGGTGSYKTGSVTNTSLTSGNIITTDSSQRGWGVFDLSSIPSGTVINSCVVGFYVADYGDTGTPSGWTTYGRRGDFSAIDTPSVLFSDCISGSVLSTATYGTDTGVKTLASTAASDAFMTEYEGDTVSLSWTGGGTRAYTITGTAGTDTTIGAHAPYIKLSYCTGVASVTATPSSIDLCVGSTLTLTGAGTGITSYSWAGPHSYTSTLESPTLTVDTASSGVYYFTGYNSGGCAVTVTTASVTVTKTPAPVLGYPFLCLGSTDSLFDETTGGTWSITPAAVATISATGLITPVSAGTVVVTYSCGTHSVTTDMTVNKPPSAIIGIDTICEFNTAGLADTSGVGTWSSSPVSIATINSVGVVSGIAGGTAIITFTKSSTSCFTTSTMRINPVPSPIMGTSNECVGQTATLSDTAAGGKWRSANPGVAVVDSITGVVTGFSAGGVIITYTTGCGTVTIVNTVKPLPGAIAGKDSVCQLSSSLLSDDINGGTWTSNDTAIATVPSGVSGSAEAYGLAVGVTTITYTLNTGCYITTPFTVAQLPDSILLPPPPLTACINEPYYPTDDVIGGTWSSADTSIATISDFGGLAVLTGTHAGTVTITYSVRPGCPVSTTVKVSNLPPLFTGTNDICPGSNDTLIDATPGGTWSSADTTIAAVNSSGVLTGIAGGPVSIIYTAPTGCSVSTVENIYPRPVPVFSYNSADGTLSVDTTGNIHYQWYAGTTATDSTLLAGATSYNIAVLYNEVYFVVVTDSLGCTGAADTSLVNLSVKNMSGCNAVNIYPNPATSTLYINTALNLHVVVSDMEGNTVIQQQDKKQIDIRKLASGIYTISFYSQNGQPVATQKFVKE